MSNLILSQPDNLSYPLTADQVESLDRMLRELYTAILNINTFVGVPGILPPANGGTGSSATPPAGGVAYGTGSIIAFTGPGTSGQVLTSQGGGEPTFEVTVETVTDDGNGVVAVNNTDPSNPIVKFNGVNVDGTTITGNGTSGSPLVSVGGGGAAMNLVMTRVVLNI